MRDKLLIPRMKAAMIDLPIISVLWAVVWGVIIYIRFEMLQDLGLFNVTVVTIISITGFIFPLPIIFLRNDLLPGCRWQKISVLDKIYQQASLKQKLIKTSVTFFIMLLLFLIELFVIDKYDLEREPNYLFGSNIGDYLVFFLIICNLALYATYLLLLVIELLTGVNLPNRIAGIQVVQRQETPIEL